MLNSFKSLIRASAIGAGVLFSFFTIPAAFGADSLKADVPFAFQVGSRTLPAGPYEITINHNDNFVSVLGSTKVKGDEAVENIMTTLAPSPHSTAADAHIVFDKAGGKYILSELWEPDAEGVLVHAEKGKHEHHVLHVKR